MSAETTELQAPPGTFQRLTSLEGNRLGNVATARFVSVLRMPNIWPDLYGNPNLTSDMAVVQLRIRHRRKGSNEEESYYLGIKPEDHVVLIEAWRYNDRVGRTTLFPTLDFLLREISIAERLQPKLKRK